VLYGVTEEEFQEVLKSAGGKGAPKYAEVLNAGTYDAACEAVKRVDPRSWVNNGDRIRENLRFEFHENFPPYLCNECFYCSVNWFPCPRHNLYHA